MQNLAISDVQNTLIDDALRRNVSLLQSNLNQPAFKSGGFSPTGELTPSTGILANVEKVKKYLKNNVEHMPKLSTGKGGKSRNYTAGEIDNMQTNRLLQLYEQTKQNIQQLSADEINDPEIGYTTPKYTEQGVQEKIRSGQKLGREEYRWLAEMGLLDTVPQSAFKLQKND